MIKIISQPIIIQIDKLPNKILKNIPKNIKSSEIVNSNAYIISIVGTRNDSIDRLIKEVINKMWI